MDFRGVGVSYWGLSFWWVCLFRMIMDLRGLQDFIGGVDFSYLFSLQICFVLSRQFRHLRGAKQSALRGIHSSTFIITHNQLCAIHSRNTLLLTKTSTWAAQKQSTPTKASTHTPRHTKSSVPTIPPPPSSSAVSPSVSSQHPCVVPSWTCPGPRDPQPLCPHPARPEKPATRPSSHLLVSRWIPIEGPALRAGCRGWPRL